MGVLFYFFAGFAGLLAVHFTLCKERTCASWKVGNTAPFEKGTIICILAEYMNFNVGRREEAMMGWVAAAVAFF